MRFEKYREIWDFFDVGESTRLGQEWVPENGRNLWKTDDFPPRFLKAKRSVTSFLQPLVSVDGSAASNSVHMFRKWFICCWVPTLQKSIIAADDISGDER